MKSPLMFAPGAVTLLCIVAALTLFGVSDDSDAYPTDVHYKFTVTFEVPGVSGCDYYVIDYGDGYFADSRHGTPDGVTSSFDPDRNEYSYSIVHTYPEVPGIYQMVFRAYNTGGDVAESGLNVSLMGYPVLSFVTNGGSHVEDLMVTNGPSHGGVAGDDYYTAPVRPADPSRDGMSFDGWFTDEALTIPFDWNEPLRTSTTLYAGWTEDAPLEYTVTFYVNREIYDQRTYIAGEVITAPENPHRDGYTFLRWKNFTEGMTVTDDTGFCAVFESAASVAFKVTYTVDGVTNSVYLSPGVDAQLPDPVLSGKRFEGWYTDPSFNNGFDPSELTGDTTLYAKFSDEDGNRMLYSAVAVALIGVVLIGVGYRRSTALMMTGALVIALATTDATGVIDVIPR